MGSLKQDGDDKTEQKQMLFVPAGSALERGRAACLECDTDFCTQIPGLGLLLCRLRRLFPWIRPGRSFFVEGMKR